MLVLVACSKSKLAVRARACDLYTGALFRLSVRYAESLTSRWAILSAKHGLVLPHEELDPYELRLQDMTRPQLEDWKRRVGLRIAEEFGPFLPGSRIVYLAGVAYAECHGHVPGPRAEKVEPMRRMQIGERLAWLKLQLRARTLPGLNPFRGSAAHEDAAEYL